MNISPSKPLTVWLKNAEPKDHERLNRYRPLLMKLAKLTQCEALPEDQTPPPSATALSGHLEVLIPMAGLINKEEELARLDKELQKLEKEKQQLQGKLSNQNFVERAPAEIVEKERQRLLDTQEKIKKLTEKRAEVAAL
jgi:valyl-tRNA synthetase